LTRTFYNGEEVGRGKDGGILRYLGYSRSRGANLAVDVTDGELYRVETLVALGESVSPLPDVPDDAPGTPAWVDWAKACSDAAVPHLDLAEPLPKEIEDEAGND
jgi:hypothetical protein